MGGKGSGGRRPGAGAKKKATHLRMIDGGAGRRGAAPAPDAELPPVPSASAGLLEPPAGLRAREADVWRAWAPLAYAVGTLDDRRAANFRLLCRAVADQEDFRARNGWGGEVAGEPRPLLVMSTKEEHAFLRMDLMLTKTIHAWMKDFMIAPFGKELAPPGDPGAGREVDPIDRFMRK